MSRIIVKALKDSTECYQGMFFFRNNDNVLLPYAECMKQNDITTLKQICNNIWSQYAVKMSIRK